MDVGASDHWETFGETGRGERGQSQSPFTLSFVHSCLYYLPGPFLPPPRTGQPDSNSASILFPPISDDSLSIDIFQVTNVCCVSPFLSTSLTSLMRFLLARVSPPTFLHGPSPRSVISLKLHLFQPSSLIPQPCPSGRDALPLLGIPAV